MKRIAWLTLLLAVTSMMLAMNSTIAVSSERTNIQLLSNNQSGMTVQYSVGELEYQDITTQDGIFTEISINGYTSTNQTGLPKLPLLRQIISVPLNAEIIPRLSNLTTSQISLIGNGIANPILPRQETLSKSADQALVPFVKDHDFYNNMNWTNYGTIDIKEIGMLRGTRLVALDFIPIKYNPSTAQLEITTSVTVDIVYSGADWAATEELKNRYYSSAFEPFMMQSVFNYDTIRASLDRYPLGMLIITPASYVTTLQPFVNWKKMQGYNVTVATTDVAGTTTTAIKSYIQNIWNSATTANPAPSYLIIAGDIAQIPAWNGTTSGSHVTDVNYARLQGTDYIPEMYVGRFSAINTTQLQAIIDKTLQYEKYSMPDPSYLSHTVLIAGMDSGNGGTYGNGQIRYGKDNYFGESTSPNWTPYGPYQIKNHMYLYPNSGNSDAQIIQDASNGIGFINYTAHGSETSWSDPTFSVGNVNGLTNANKYFVAVGNCCLSNSFDTGECLGEAFIRASNKGAVAYIGATDNSYWDEDYYWAVGHKPPVVGTGSPYIANKIGAYDAVFHNHDEAYADWANSVGAMNFMGNMAVEAFNSSRVDYYWEVYAIMGDPSLIPYMGIPTNNTVQYSAAIPIGFNAMQITADPHTYVAISRDNVLHGAGQTDSAGHLTLSFTPFTTPGTAKLVMTRSLRKPIIADINVTSSTGPYLLVNTLTVNDGDNSIPEAGETLYLNMTLLNVGTVAANNITVTVSTTNPYVNVITGSSSIASIQTNATANINNTIQVEISSAIPDQQVVTFTCLMNDNSGNTWTETRSFTVNAPNVTIGNPTYYDPNNNGAYEQGETITINFGLTNNGHMNAPSATLVVVNNSDDASLGQSVFTIQNLNIGVNVPISVTATISQTATLSSIVPLGLALTVGEQLVNGMLSLMIGSVSEGFETGIIASPPWINQSTIPWTMVAGTSTAHSGNICVRSGAISHGDSTIIRITKNVSTAGTISFWEKIGSEGGYDKLAFFIDGVLKDTWSGVQAWTYQHYDVTPGVHTFSWRYKKDYSNSTAPDCAWIDDIVFPISGDANVPVFYSSETTLSFDDVPINSMVSKSFYIRNLGQASLTGTITIPQQFILLENGNQVGDTYNFNIPTNTNKLYTLRISVSAPTNFNDQIMIVSNDANHPSQNISLHLSTVGNEDPEVLPVATKLDGNFPNPFNPVTSIRYYTKEPGNVAITIFNSKGQIVKTLVNENKKSGNHSVTWNGTDDNGKPVSSGIYLYRMQAKDFNQIKKMMLMK